MSEQEGVSEGALIAVIGMAGRFPGARNLDDYWRNLAAGVESVKFFTDEELLARGESPEALADPSYVRAWPVLDDIDAFDAGFFGMSPRDAAVMDPQHRIFLQESWAALEDAGYDPDRLTAPVGVFAANGMNTYMMYHLVTNREVMETVGEWLVRHTGNDMNFLATRVSYQMNLKGPSMNVQTACSSSLVAVHTACQSLLNGECDLALAGASALSLPQDRGYFFKEGEILSRDGHCRPFDAGSRGTLFGSGAGCVVLKRLADARADGDRIRAVIRGSAINNDGSLKVGYLAPSVDGQVRAVSEALAISGVDPETITFIEAHGTGTAIGDPIEITALTQAFRGHTDKRGFCAIGSVKANIGHLGEAAGMAGLIKAVLAMEHRQIPPSINYDRPNPEIDFAASPVFVNTKLVPWKGPNGAPLRAGVTALGAGGTNAHMILEEGPARAPSSRSRAHQLVAFSARTEAALERMTDGLVAHLRAHPQLELADAAYTLLVGRKQFSHRRTVVARNAADLLVTLEKRDPKRIATQAQSKSAGSIAFMFPGGGAQYAGMGQELYQTEPVYKEALDHCLGALPAAAAATVRSLLFPPPGEVEAASRKLEQPSLTLPALFATEYAMAKLLMSWDLIPGALIGHSMGEYVAAALAGVISPRDGMAMVTLRGRLFETLPAGAMLSVALSEEEAAKLVGTELSVGAVNGPNLCMLSGPVAAIEAVQKLLTEREIENTRIHISVAAHSKMLAPILDEFERFCRTIKLAAPTIPLMSNLTGAWLTEKDATDPTYWVRHLRQTVRFSQGLAKLVEGEDRVLVEVGPGRTLSSLAKQQPPPVAPALPTLRHPKEPGSDVAFLLQTLGKLWSYGIKPDWSLYYGGEQRQRVPLPSYPFEQGRYWIERGDPGAAAPRKSGSPAKQKDVADWFRLPSWKRAVAPAAALGEGPWLIFTDTNLGPRLARRLEGQVIRVIPGPSFLRIEPDLYRLRPGSREDYVGLIEELQTIGRMPAQIVHLWSVAPRPLSIFPAQRSWAELERFDASKELCFDSLLCLAQALGEYEQPLTLSVVSNDLHSLAGEPVASPEQALLLGPTRVIPRELPNVRARNIDIHLGTLRPGAAEPLLDRLIAELKAPVSAPVVALRWSDRWVQTFDQVRLEKPAEPQKSLRSRGVYLITGGLGGIGLELAEHLARLCKARLVLVGRSGFPAREEWDRWLARHGASNSTSQRIRRLMAIEALGGEALVLSADVTNRVEMEAVVAAARARFGGINGVVHAAGTIDDGLIALKSAEVAAGVIATKAKGALVLDALLATDTLDFFVSCSSVSSILGLEGQIDYTAANAFLDAFSQKKGSPRRPRSLSINWNAWQQIGMAVNLAERGRGQPQATSGQKGPTSLLSRLISDGPVESVFATHFNRDEHWLLSEHLIRNADPVIPGTGYLELARSALAARPQPRTVELSNVFFLAPFAVHGAETKTLKLKLARGADGGGDFVVFSKSEDAPHVTGRIGYVDAVAPPRTDVQAILDRCREREQICNGFLEQPFVEFGPRWANIERIRYGKGEAVVSLALPAEFEGDLAELHLHPALLDMATGAAQALVPGFDQARDFFVPFSYGRVRLYRPLPARSFSHIRFKRGTRDVISFEIALLDENGERIADLDDFTMKRVDQAGVMTGERPEAAGAPGSRLGAVVQQGILPAEGMDAFDRLLASSIDRQVVACSVDLGAWIEKVDADSQPVEAAKAEGGAEGAGFSRPQLSTNFVGPRDTVELELAGMWRELLGVKEVGVNDDFFELGGQSLIAVRLFNKIRHKYSVDLPLSTLFEAPTIAGCAAIVREEAGLASVPIAAASEAPAAETNGVSEAEPEAEPESINGAPKKKSRWTSLVVMQGKGALPPFYCVAGMGGTLNNLRKLALLVGDARPFYGLQPPGADDPTQRLWSIEDLAVHYINEIRKVQPAGPYLLGGYSGGGIVAFEMARRLAGQGETISFLGFIDSYSPNLPQRSSSDRAKIHLQRMKTEGPRYIYDMAWRRWTHERITFVQRVQKQLAKVFPEKYRYENIQDAWAVAEGRYRATPWPGGKGTLFRAREESAIGLWTGVEVDERNGWGRYLDSVEVQLCSGNHTTLCEEPHVRKLAAKLRDALDRASPAPVEGTVLNPAAAI
jgi:acyl transferase domain-containing protein/thioesterase domain-containing protein